MSRLIPTKNITYETAYNILCSSWAVEEEGSGITYEDVAKKYGVPVEDVISIRNCTFLDGVGMIEDKGQKEFKF
jgi:hypothetical protein